MGIAGCSGPAAIRDYRLGVAGKVKLTGEPKPENEKGTLARLMDRLRAVEWKGERLVPVLAVALRL